ncbi:tetratricopeptide repeat protein [Roseivirga thermotolerans]|uniref:tetratricopeptide repeat protein n=1 Tax=Roseivirga thermotolerans TaxID=1758176 RepID=UPI00273E5E25|nr:tetratricopeptide repeat protein [Roseivirga thermotolerans]
MKKVFQLIVLVSLLVACDSDQDKAGRFFIKGNEALNQGQYNEAVRYYTEAIALAPSMKEAYNNRGVAYYKDGRYAEAINDYSYALVQIDEHYADAIRNRANAYLADHRHSKAIEDLNRLQRIYPDSSFVYFTKGIALHEDKAYAEAIDAFEKALTMQPNDAEAMVNQANSFYMLQEFEQAEQLLNRAESIDASEPNIYNTRGLIAMEKKEYSNALNWFNIALKMDPGNAYYLNNRGYLYLQMNRISAAEEDLRRAIIGAPNNAWAYRNRGYYFHLNKRFEDAIRNFELAAKMDNEVPLLHFYWAQTLQSLNRGEEACEILSRETTTLPEVEDLRQQVCR